MLIRPVKKAPFAAVDLAGSNDVTIHVGGKQSVVVTADDNLIDDVTTRVERGKLVIGTASGSFTTNVPMKVDVTVPALDAMTLSGSGIVTAEGIDAKRLTVALPGSGILRASGAATALVVDHSGSGDAQLEGLVAADVHAVLGGSGRIVVNAADPAVQNPPEIDLGHELAAAARQALGLPAPERD